MSSIIDGLENLSDKELEEAMRHVNAEYHSRLLNSDLFYSVKEKIIRTSDLSPTLETGHLVCFGEKIITSKHNHKCSFTQVNGVWVWESDYLLKEWVDYVNAEGSMETLSLVAPIEGLELKKINSLFKGETHKLISIETYLIIEGKLEKIKSRNLEKVNFKNGF